MTSTVSPWVLLLVSTVSAVLAAVLGFGSAIALQQRSIGNARRDELQRIERIDRSVRLQVLAYLKAAANEVRSAFTLGMMPLSIMTSFYDRLHNRLLDKDVPQAFPDHADVLYDALAACDFAIGIQRLHEGNWTREGDKAAPDSHRIEQRTQMIRGIWTNPFLKLEDVFKRVGDAETVQEFAKARSERAEIQGR
jgi:hypothetical protein